MWIIKWPSPPSKNPDELSDLSDTLSGSEATSSGQESPDSSPSPPENASSPQAPASGSRKRWREEDFDENELCWAVMLVEALELLELQPPTRGSFFHRLDDPERSYYVELYSPEAMKRARSACGIDEAGFRESLSTLDDTGRSFQRNGRSQWVSKDGLLLVKQLTFPEAQKLHKIIDDYSAFVCESSGASLLSKIYCAFHEYSGAYYLVTENTPPARNASAESIRVCGSEFIQLQGMLARDTLFLQKHGLMDYTLRLCGKAPRVVIDDMLVERSPRECVKVAARERSWKRVARLLCCVWPSYRRKRAREEGDAMFVDDKYHLQ